MWQAVVRRDPSHSHGSVNEAATLRFTLSSDELNRWKNFPIQDVHLLHKGQVRVPMGTKHGAKHYMSVMID